MNREALIGRTLESLSRLPESKLSEVADFAEFLLSRVEDRLTTEGIQLLVADSEAFDFLNDEEELYSLDDLKERYR